jgi:hypothetical protein
MFQQDIPPAIHAPHEITTLHDSNGRQIIVQQHGQAVETRTLEPFASASGTSAGGDAEANVPADSNVQSSPSDASGTRVESRPKWTQQLAGWDAPTGPITGVEGKPRGATWKEVIHISPEANPISLERRISRAIEDRVSQFVASELGRDGFDTTGFDMDNVELWRSRLITAQHEEIHDKEVSSESAPVRLREVWLLLEIDPAAQQEFIGQINAAIVNRRLVQTGAVGGTVVALLASVFGFLKLDTATRGYYTGRLRFLAGAVILGIIALGMFVVRA